MSTLLLEAVVESKLIAAVEGLALSGTVIQGFWNPKLLGDVKNSDTPSGALVFCIVNPRSYASYGTPTLRFTATIKVNIRPCQDARGYILPQVFKSIMSLCMAWKADAAAARSALSQISEFQCDGVTISPGGQLGIDPELWSASIQLEIAGTEL